MRGTDTRLATIVSTGLIAAGAAIAAIGGTNADPRVAGTLPPMGAGLLTAGMALLLLAHRLNGRQAVIVGATLVATGAVVAAVGATVPVAAVAISLPAIGGALVAAGTLELVSGAATLDSEPKPVPAARAG